MTMLATLLALAAAPVQAAAPAPRPVLVQATARVEIVAVERVSLDPPRGQPAPLQRQVDRATRTVQFF